MKAGNPTRQYLNLLAKTQEDHEFSPTRWLLENAIELERGPLPSHVYRQPTRHCCWNSLRLAEKHPGRYVYMEGWATAIIPVEHAWCFDRETGLVVDATWAEDTGQSYIGVPLKASYVRYCFNRGRPALYDWTNGFPIMRGTMPEAQWREAI